MVTPQGRPERFLAYSTAGPQRDLARDAREQPWWDEHATFIDGLVGEGFIQLGGPLDDEGGGFLVVLARDEVEARERLRHDPRAAMLVPMLIPFLDAPMPVGK